MPESFNFHQQQQCLCLCPWVATQHWRGPIAFVVFDVWRHCKWLFAEPDCDAKCHDNVDVGSEKGNVSVEHPLQRRAVLS